VIHRQLDLEKLKAPEKIPRYIADIEEDLTPPSSGSVPGSVPSADTGGVPGSAIGIFGPVPTGVAPPPPVKTPTAATPPRIRVGGIVQEANLIRRVQPVYPALARQARIQGAVHFTAIIGRDGAIQNLQLINGHPLLVEAARQAVSQWRYKPTLLNGEPVEVVTQIDVNFTLTQ
jgi:protein TonB